MAGGAQDDELFVKIAMVDCWVIHPPSLDFHGAGGGGVYHGPVNARPRAERLRRAYRRRQRP